MPKARNMNGSKIQDHGNATNVNKQRVTLYYGIPSIVSCIDIRSARYVRNLVVRLSEYHMLIT